MCIDDPGRQDQHWRVAPLLDVVQGAGHGEDDRAVYREESYPLLNVACPGDGCATVCATSCGAGPRPRGAGRGFGQGIIHNGSHEVVGAVVAHRDRQGQIIARHLVVLTDVNINVRRDCGWCHGCPYRRASR